MNIALIVAGGKGTRTLQEVPKQFLCVDDKPIIVHTLEKFEHNANIDKIIVVCLEGWEQVVLAYAKQFNLAKLKKVVLAGENRFLSIYNGIKYIENFANPYDVILVYDANRPLISDDIIDDSIEKCKAYGCACGAMPCFDTMLLSDTEKNNVIDTVNRNILYRGMGPETAKFSLVLKEFNYYNSKGVYDYTMSEMFLRKGYNVAISKSSSKCFKITTIEDIETFVALYNSKKYKWLK